MHYLSQAHKKHSTNDCIYISLINLPLSFEFSEVSFFSLKRVHTIKIDLWTYKITIVYTLLYNLPQLWASLSHQNTCSEYMKGSARMHRVLTFIHFHINWISYIPCDSDESDAAPEFSIVIGGECSRTHDIRPADICDMENIRKTKQINKRKKNISMGDKKTIF